MFRRVVILVVMMVAILAVSVRTKPQDPNSHCEAMKDNPACQNYGPDKNCECVRVKGPDGTCPMEGSNCNNHCCRNKCKCHHPQCVDP